MADLEFESSITRNEFKELIDKSNIKTKLDKLLMDANAYFVENDLKIDQFELVGEATRMPYINDEVVSVFGVK